MEHTKRNITIIVFIIAVGALGWFLFSNPKVTTPPSIVATTTLTFNGPGLSFIYPKELTFSQKNDTLVLHHEIPYKNTGGCDMMGDEKTYDTFTDFHITIRIASTSLVKTVKQMSSYIPEENFEGTKLKIHPGFIDSFRAGILEGFAIYEGAEGCGFTTYYFSIPDNKTLIIQKESIQALSGVRGNTEIQKILAIPGVISKEESEMMFMRILNSLILK